MNRRTFIGASAATLAFPGVLIAAGAEMIDYEPGLLAQKLADGETVLVDFAADWCSTCARQERVISDLRANNPAYDEHITFVRVDWDRFGRDTVTTSRKVPRRSTLILLKDDKELGRIVAGTSVDDIKSLLDLGVPAS
jgi:thiol-disulfide isomerase/thioredoxin